MTMGEAVEVVSRTSLENEEIEALKMIARYVFMKAIS